MAEAAGDGRDSHTFNTLVEPKQSMNATIVHPRKYAIYGSSFDLLHLLRKAIVRSEREARQAIEKYADTVRRICFVHLKNHHDTEDVFQEVFLKLLMRKEAFESETHERAWVIRVSINACKDTLKNFFRKKQVPLDDLIYEPHQLDNEHHEVLDAVLRLPTNYRMVIHLFYYEGYTAPEISRILNKNDNTIYTWLSRAREQLKNSLGGDFLET